MGSKKALSTRASQASQGAVKRGLGWPQGEELGATISVSIALMRGAGANGFALQGWQAPGAATA